MNDNLAARLAEDLDGSFEALVMAHQDRLYTIALRLLGDPRDAEEIAQDAFVRAYRAMATYEPARTRELQLRPWLAAIVVNLCRNRATRHRRRPEGSPAGRAGETGSIRTALRSDGAAGSPQEAAIRREEAAHWASLLAGLPPRYRAPIVLHHIDGLSFPEMAVALGRPEGTLKAQVHRGLALLRAAHDAAIRAGEERERERERQELSA
jgi:RNA polymerase sigma-70 factor, ECF subfamily